MNKFTKMIRKIIPLLVLFCLALGISTSQAQLKEPEVREVDQPLTPLSQGYHNSLSFNVMLNNFGFGLGGEYTKVVGPYTQLTFRTGITGIRDVSEQNFQDFFTGQRIIPNKYKRAFGFPFLFGIERRLFAEHISDNFRFFVSSAAGPALAFTYPYVNDSDGNGYRTRALQTLSTGQQIAVPIEGVNDFFTGWSEGDTHWGFNGELKVGVAIGENMKRQTKIEFGYFFYYFKQGLEIMEPNQPQTNDNGQVIYGDDGLPVGSMPFFDPQKYFGTPQITITFGGMW